MGIIHKPYPSGHEVYAQKQDYAIMGATFIKNRDRCWTTPYMGDMNQSKNSSTIEELYTIVRGRVQGVGFRYFVVEKAASLGLRGYARNESNGDVEVLAQGPRMALEHLLSLLRQGPSAAYVSDIQVIWREPTEHVIGFHVRW